MKEKFSKYIEGQDLIKLFREKMFPKNFYKNHNNELTVITEAMIEGGSS